MTKKLLLLLSVSLIVPFMACSKKSDGPAAQAAQVEGPNAITAVQADPATVEIVTQSELIPRMATALNVPNLKDVLSNTDLDRAYVVQKDALPIRKNNQLSSTSSRYFTGLAFLACQMAWDADQTTKIVFKWDHSRSVGINSVGQSKGLVEMAVRVLGARIFGKALTNEETAVLVTLYDNLTKINGVTHKEAESSVCAAAMSVPQFLMTVSKF